MAGYTLLPTSEKIKANFQSRRQTWTHHTWTFLVALSIFLNFILIFTQLSATEECASMPNLYSPAEKAVKYKITKFHSGFFDDVTDYMGPPSDELDQRWDALYAAGVNRIPKSQAALLPNKTAPIPGDEGYYIITLDVFHQLHCLNMIRKALYPDYYHPMHVAADGEDNLLGFTHIDHCVDTIRQSLMCHSDISVLPFQWKDSEQDVKIWGQIPHVCRDFDQINEWAEQNRFIGHFDSSVHLTDDIVIPEFHVD